MWIIDRFEETIAVIETDDGMTEIPRSQILGDAREGDILRQNPDGSYQTDTAATQARRESLPLGHGGSWENNGWNNR